MQRSAVVAPQVVGELPRGDAVDGIVAPGRGAELDFSAVVAQRQTVAVEREVGPERIVAVEVRGVDGHLDSAACVGYDQRAVELSVVVVGRDDAPQPDVARERHARFGAERLQMGDAHEHGVGPGHVAGLVRLVAASGPEETNEQQDSRFHPSS